MKKLFYLITVLGILLFASCEKDKCYKCEAYDTIKNIKLDTEFVCGEEEKADYMNDWNDSDLNCSAICREDIYKI